MQRQRRTHRRPIVIGLTGSIGMGKSRVGRMFRHLKVPVFDADAAVRELQGPGGRALAAIEAAFPGTTGPQGVDRERLGARVFADAQARRILEAILHPEVGRARDRFIRQQRSRRAVVLDVPLLFEAGGWRLCDLLVVVSAPARVQRARVLARPGMHEARFDAIRASQMPDAEKRARADLVIPTGRGLLASFRGTRQVVRMVRAGCLPQHEKRRIIRSNRCGKSCSIPRPPVFPRTMGTGSLRWVPSSWSNGWRPGGASTPG